MTAPDGRLIIDPFGGPGGWAEGLLSLGLSEIGVELDPWACATRRAAGHRVVQADVTRFPVDHLVGRVDGLVMSPPCQAFSVAGIARCDGGVARPPEPTHAKQPGASLFGELRPWVSMAEALGWDGQDQPARTVAGHRSPRWLYPDRDGTHGRVLNRRQQTRGVPSPLVAGDQPAPTLTGIAGAKGQWVWERPSTTIAGDPRITARCHHDHGSQGARAKTTGQVQAGDYDGTEPIKLTLPEALILQGFRPDYPVQGNKTQQFRQVGDAVPPPLAAAVVGALVGVSAEAAA